jgi:hypothetical protein
MLFTDKSQNETGGSGIIILASERHCLRKEESRFRPSSEKSQKQSKPEAARRIVLFRQFHSGIYT